MPTADTTPGDPFDRGQETDVGGDNVLVLASEGGEAAHAYCSERLAPSHRTVPPNALLISLEQSPDERFDTIVRNGSERPSNVAVVCCDETRSTAAVHSGAGHGPGLTPGPWTATVGSPGDLTGLGVRIRQALSSWEDDPEPVELCFHNLETLVEHVDDRAAFRFCHAVTRHIRSTDGGSHFHLDPEAVSERTLNTLRPLFDRVEDLR